MVVRKKFSDATVSESAYRCCEAQPVQFEREILATASVV
jgi:hypothetical protein